MGATGDLCVCRLCVLDSRLGMLIGDALDTVADIAKALLATERHVYRSRLMAFERRDRAALEVERYTIDRGPLDP